MGYNTMCPVEYFHEHTNCVMERFHALEAQGEVGASDRCFTLAPTRPLHSWGGKLQSLPQSWEFPM
eukprot:9912039-Ditylum_brightwellii.AAC.1